MKKVKEWLVQDKWRLASLVTWLIVAILGTIFFIVAKPYQPKENLKIEKLKWQIEDITAKLQKQKLLTDSMIRKNSIIMYEIKRDSVVIPKIIIKYENRKDSVRNLSVDESVMFLSKWLSKEAGSR
jgi:hypothetical protein